MRRDDPEQRRYRSDKPVQPWSHVRVWLICGGTLSLLYGLARDPRWVEDTYVRGWGSTLAGWLGWLTSPIPISLAELLVALLIVVEALLFLTGGAEVLAGRRRLRNAVLCGLTHAVDLALVSMAWFALVWGVSYARVPAEERFGLPMEKVDETDDASVALLLGATLKAIERTNEAYVALHGTTDAGQVTTPPRGLDMDAAVERAFARLGERRQLGDHFVAPRGRVKRPLLSSLLSYFGTSGIYVPFTGEATVNGGPPAWSQLATAAHEKAHQRMEAPEDDATFVGFLALVHSDEPLLRYAGWDLARRQLQAALVSARPEALAEVEGRLHAGPQRDLIALYGYWEVYRGPMQEFHEAVNDRYLRLNGVEGGVASYARAAQLVAAWSETTEGQALLGGAKPGR